MQLFTIHLVSRNSLKKSIQFFSELLIFLQIYFHQGKMTNIWLLIVTITLCYADCKATSTCEKKIAISYLDTAVAMIAKVNSTFPAGSTEALTCQEKISIHDLNIAVGMIREAKSTVSRISGIDCEKNITREKNITEPIRRALDCSELLAMGSTKSGVYTIWPQGKSLKVYCDMQTNGGGWTLIQKRGNFGRPIDYFFKDWKSYKEGFGDVEKDFWLGNDNIYALTNQKTYSARFDLKDVDQNTRYAEYSTFRIEDENQKYRLYLLDYTGDAGDSMAVQNNQKFSTKDQDNDLSKDSSCAQMYKGAWWYNNCHDSNLNGLYYRGIHQSLGDGVNWYTWKGLKESMESTEIKIRPKSIK